jgi:hypothetical protein
LDEHTVAVFLTTLKGFEDNERELLREADPAPCSSNKVPLDMALLTPEESAVRKDIETAAEFSRLLGFAGNVFAPVSSL